MAKTHCTDHRRYVPSCVKCQAENLRSQVGFPGGQTEGPSTNPLPDEDDENAPIPVIDEAAEATVRGGEVQSEAPEDENDGCPGCGHSFDTCECPYPELVDAAQEEADLTVKGTVDAGPDVPEGTPNLAVSGTVTLGEDAPEQGPRQMSPIELAMFLFPVRHIPEGTTPVMRDGEEPVEVEYRELIQKALEGWLEMGLNPEDAVHVVVAEVIKTDVLGITDEPTPEEEELAEGAFEAGLEAAPELTGCIADYNDGFNGGMVALLAELTEFYGPGAVDADAAANEMLAYAAAKMAELTKPAEEKGE